MLRVLAGGLCDVSGLRCSQDADRRGRCLPGAAGHLRASYLLAQSEAKVGLGVWLFSPPGLSCLLE